MVAHDLIWLRISHSTKNRHHFVIRDGDIFDVPA